MRAAPCVWILLAGVLLLATCTEAGHGKRKKIVVFVPQKVKHIHHHHVKKVYVKKQRPHVEYIEDGDDYLHRAGEGDDEAVIGGPGGSSWDADDDKVLQAAASDHYEDVVLAEQPSWGQKLQAAEAPDEGWRASGEAVTPAPAQPAVDTEPFAAHVGRSGEVGQESRPDPGVVGSQGGWTGLPSSRHQRPQQHRHPAEHRHRQQQGESQHRQHPVERHEQQHNHHRHHHEHQQRHNRPEPQQHHSHQEPQQHHSHQEPQQHHSHQEPQQHHSHQEPQQHHSHQEPQQHHSLQEYQLNSVHNKKHGKLYHREDHSREETQEHPRQQHVDEHGVPDDVRSWVLEGFEKFQQSNNSKKKAVSRGGEEEDDGIRVQVFEDGKEVEVTKAKPEPTDNKQHTGESEKRNNSHHHHYHHSKDEQDTEHFRLHNDKHLRHDHHDNHHGHHKHHHKHRQHEEHLEGASQASREVVDKSPREGHHHKSKHNGKSLHHRRQYHREELGHHQHQDRDQRPSAEERPVAPTRQAWWQQ